MGPFGRELEAATRLAREAGRLQMDLYGRLTARCAPRAPERVRATWSPKPTMRRRP